jgi:hypothetical protein
MNSEMKTPKPFNDKLFAVVLVTLFFAGIVAAILF